MTSFGWASIMSPDQQPEGPPDWVPNPYEAVGDDKLYRSINEDLVDLAGPLNGCRVLDLGCGTGSISEIVLQRAGDVAVVAVDPAAELLRSVSERLGGAVMTVEATAEEYTSSSAPASFDVVFLANCVHLVNEIDSVLEAIYGLLAPGGRLVFNTAFHDDAGDPSQKQLYWSLVLEAKRLARSRGGGRPRSRTVRPLAKRSLTASGYMESLRRIGYSEVHSAIRTVELDADLIDKIVGAEMFAAGALPGIDPAIAAEALTEAARAILARERTPIRRSWLFVAGSRTEDDHD